MQSQLINPERNLVRDSQLARRSIELAILKMPLSDLWKKKTPEELIRQNQRALNKTMRQVSQYILFNTHHTQPALVLFLQRTGQGEREIGETRTKNHQGYQKHG